MATLIEQFTTYHSLELDFTLSLLSLVFYMYLELVHLFLLYFIQQIRLAVPIGSAQSTTSLWPQLLLLQSALPLMQGIYGYRSIGRVYVLIVSVHLPPLRMVENHFCCCFPSKMFLICLWLLRFQRLLSLLQVIHCAILIHTHYIHTLNNILIKDT